MRTYALQFPCFNVSIALPESFNRDFLSLFSPFLNPADPVAFDRRIILKGEEGSYVLEIDGNRHGKHRTIFSLLLAVEYWIGELLIKEITDWVAFHAGCVGIRESACLIPGQPDAGKTTTTLQFIEHGAALLCEEIAVVDAQKMLVYPFPRPLALDAGHMRKIQSQSAIRNGELISLNPSSVRYKPKSQWTGNNPLPLKTILLTEYNSKLDPELIPVSPGEVLTEILHCCFPPNGNEEYFFDRVIRILDKCALFRLRTNGLGSTQKLIRNIDRIY
jgi:hypothetical protein